MDQPTDRYEIHVRHVSADARERLAQFDPPEDWFVVWDRVKEREVPYGRYRDREHAQDRINRLRERVRV